MYDEEKVMAIAKMAVDEKDFEMAEQLLKLAKRYIAAVNGGFVVVEKYQLKEREQAIRECVDEYARRNREA